MSIRLNQLLAKLVNLFFLLLLLSSDGATRCGPFCVVYNALEQITVDREVDIFTIARQLQVRRTEFVSTLVCLTTLINGFSIINVLFSFTHTRSNDITYCLLIRVPNIKTIATIIYLAFLFVL